MINTNTYVWAYRCTPIQQIQYVSGFLVKCEFLDLLKFDPATLHLYLDKQTLTDDAKCKTDNLSVSISVHRCASVFDLYKIYCSHHINSLKHNFLGYCYILIQALSAFNSVSFLLLGINISNPRAIQGRKVITIVTPNKSSDRTHNDFETKFWRGCALVREGYLSPIFFEFI